MPSDSAIARVNVPLRWAGAAVLVGGGLWAGGNWISAQGAAAENPGALLGVHLGMTADQVRTHFAHSDIADGPVGTWDSETLSGGLVAMRWRRPAENIDVSGEETPDSVVFELHRGLVVAIRASFPGAITDRSVVASDVVRHTVRRTSGGSDVVVIARNCPLHRAEAERLIATAEARPLSP